MKNRRPQNANMRNRPQSFVQLMVGYSRTHWSTPLSPWPTHRRLVGRQVTVDPAHTADHHCPTTGYPYLLGVPALSRGPSTLANFTQGTVFDRINDKAFLLSRHIKVSPAHFTGHCLTTGYPYLTFWRYLPLLPTRSP